MTLVKGSQSPWGVIESAKIIVPNMITASHGGIWISKELEATIPLDCQEIVRQYAPSQWYEEDCDCCILMALLPGFSSRQVAVATKYVFDDKRFLPVRRELERRKRS